MSEITYITELGDYLTRMISERELDLNDKHTVNYDHLLEAIYRFSMDTERKDGKEPGNRSVAFQIACDKLIAIIKTENP